MCFFLVCLLIPYVLIFLPLSPSHVSLNSPINSSQKTRSRLGRSSLSFFHVSFNLQRYDRFQYRLQYKKLCAVIEINEGIERQFVRRLSYGSNPISRGYYTIAGGIVHGVVRLTVYILFQIKRYRPCID